MSVVAVYFSVLAPSAEPGPKDSAPASVVMPKSPTTFAPPLSLTIRLTMVKLAAWSSLVMVQVTFSPLASATDPVCAFELTAPAAPTQLQLPSV